MRVLFVDHGSTVSGAQYALADLVTALPPRVEATVLCPPGELSDLLEGRGVAVRHMRGTEGSLRLHPTATPRALGEMLAAGLAIRRAARATGADVVHANSIRAALMAAPPRVAAGPPLVAHVHDCLPRGPLPTAICRIIAATADAVVAVSGYTARNFVRGRPPRRIETLYNPVDLSQFDPATVDRAQARRALGLGPEPALGMVAQITPWKGQHTAIRALALLRRDHPDARLMLVGSPKFVSKATRFDNRSYEQQLHGLVAELGLEEAVGFCGERSDVPTVLAALDVLLAPSAEEPLGRAIVEAMAMATPVVATSVGGPPEFVRDGETGWLAPPGRPERWAEQIARVLGDPAAAREVARRGREEVVVRFAQDGYAARVVSLYDDLVATRS
jgi:L-malate glycosyltransferase